MKLICFAILLSFMSCTHYQTSSINKNRVMIVKNVNVLGFIQFGDVFTCQTDDSGRIDTCVKNQIEDWDAKQERMQREADEKARRAAANARTY